MIIKQIIRSLLLLGALAGQLNAQNIVAAEYYFDTDPGVTNGIGITVSSPADSINLLDSINIAGLSKGKHQFCIRYQNILGKWSHTECYPIEVTQPRVAPLIVGGEHFVDVEPGVGNGVPFSVGNPADPINLLDSLDMDTLSRGIHRFCIRYRNNMGQWSHTECHTIQVVQPNVRPSLIVGGEHFVDVEPGVGNGVPFSVTGPADPLSRLDSLDMDTLSRGVHRFCVRYQNNMGQWSHTKCYTIQVVQPQIPALIVGGEYFFDTDPGINNGMSLGSFSPADSINILDSINVTGVSTGLHVFGLRYYNNMGQWSHTERYLVQVTKQSKIVAIEYVVDGTPGVQTGTAVNVNPPAAQVVHRDSINTTPLAVGWHTVSVRAQNEFGVWSDNELDSFFVCNGGNALASVTVNNSTICEGTPVVFTANVTNGGPNPIYNWLVNGTIVSTGSTSYQTDSIQSNDQVEFYLQSNAYCVLDSTVTSTPVSVQVNLNPAVQVTASTTALCQGDNLVLTASGAQSYSWSNGIINGTAFIPFNTQTYTVIGTDANGCKDTVVTPSIVVNPLPIINFSSLNLAYCDSVTSVLLSASPAGGVFSGTAVNGSVFSPSIAGVGIYGIDYTYTDANNCTATVGQAVEVESCQPLFVSNSEQHNTIKAYPNPFGRIINVELDLQSNSNIQISVINALGQVVYESVLDQNGVYQIDLQNLSGGTYFLQTIDEQGIKTQQAIVKMN